MEKENTMNYEEFVNKHEEQTKKALEKKAYPIVNGLKEIKPGLTIVRKGFMPIIPHISFSNGDLPLDFGHAAMIIDYKGTVIEAIGDSKDKKNHDKNSVVKTGLREFFERGSVEDFYYILWASGKNGLARDSDGIKAAEYAIEKFGAWYNWDFCDRGKETEFYCSQLCWQAWGKAGYKMDFRIIGGFRKTWVSPNDLACGRNDCTVLYTMRNPYK